MQALLMDPLIVSAAAVVLSAATYGEHLQTRLQAVQPGSANSAGTGSTPPVSTIISSCCSGKASPSNSGRSTNAAASAAAAAAAAAGSTLDASSTMGRDQTNCQTSEEQPYMPQLLQAVWQLLDAHEANLQPGQLLLPGLQQQLMQTLGCNSKGFLWLASAFMAEQGRQATHFFLAAVLFTEMVQRSCSCREVMQHPPELLQQCMLLPPLLLRWALQAYRNPEQWRDAVSRAVWAVRTVGQCWQASLRLSQHHAAKQGQVNSAYLELLSSVMFESAQSVVQLLQGSIHAAAVHLRSSHSVCAVNSSAAMGCGSSGSNGMIDMSAQGTIWLAAHLSEQVPYLTHILTSRGSGSSGPNSVAGTIWPGHHAFRSTSSQGSSCGSHHAHVEATAVSGSAARGLASSIASGCCGNVLADPHTSSSSGNGSASVAEWTTLLLGAVTAFEQTMRVHTQWAGVTAYLQETTGSQSPLGAAWHGAFLMTSTAAHEARKQLQITAYDNTVVTEPCDWVLGPCEVEGSLLMWLLQHAPADQQLAVQQRVYGLLSTALKMLRIRPQAADSVRFFDALEFVGAAVRVAEAAIDQLSSSVHVLGPVSAGAAAGCSSSTAVADRGGAAKATAAGSVEATASCGEGTTSSGDQLPASGCIQRSGCCSSKGCQQG